MVFNSDLVLFILLLIYITTDYQALQVIASGILFSMASGLQDI